MLYDIDSLVLGDRGLCTIHLDEKDAEIVLFSPSADDMDTMRDLSDDPEKITKFILEKVRESAPDEVGKVRQMSYLQIYDIYSQYAANTSFLR